MRFTQGLSGLVVVAGLVVAPSAAAQEATLYVDNRTNACSDSGPGSEAVPLCTLQVAADVAQAGQVVSVRGKHRGVGISSAGTAEAPVVFDGGGTASISATTLADEVAVQFWHARHVVVRNFTIRGAGYAGVRLVNSHHVTVEGNDVGAAGAGVRVEEGSTAAAVVKNRIGQSFGEAIRVDGGADHLIGGNHASEAGHLGVVVTDAPWTAVVGNTVLRACATGMSITGDATGSTVANNIIAYTLGTEQNARCAAAATELRVDGTAAAGLTADHNVVYRRHTLAPYDWAARAFTDAAVLSAESGQGAHDVNAEPGLDLDGFAPVPREGSPAIDSANADAPGASTTDFLGRPRVDDPLVPDRGTGWRSHHDRGAFEHQDSFTAEQWAVSATRVRVRDRIAVSSTLTDAWDLPFTCTIDYGDGTAHTGPCADSHAYTRTGVFTITAVASNAAHLTSRHTWTVEVLPRRW